MNLLDQLIDFFINYGYFAVFGVLLLCGFGLPVPEDITLVAGGVISSLACDVEGGFLKSLTSCHSVHVMLIVAMFGVLIGDSTMFLLGRTFGIKLLKVKFFARIITDEKHTWVQEKFERYGVWVIFAARFMPGLRSPIFVITGMTRKVSYLKFLITDGLAAIISVPIWIYLGFWGERQLSDISTLEHYVKKGQTGVFIIIGITVFTLITVWFVKKKIKEKTSL